MEKYSVLTSIYKNVIGGELSISIDSMLSQSLPPDEIVIVMDGPISDEVRCLVESYKEKFPDLFTIVPLAKNQGLAVALNKGLEAARNDLIARMDADDYSIPQRCEKQLSFFEEDPELVLLGGCSRHFVKEPSDASEEYMHRAVTTDEIKRILRRSNPFSHPSMMYRKSIIVSCGGYDDSLRRRQDLDLVSKLIYEGYKVSNIDEPIVYTRKDDVFMQRNRNKESCDMRIEVQKRILQRKQCSIIDYLYVWITINSSRLIPSSLYDRIYHIAKKI